VGVATSDYSIRAAGWAIVITGWPTSGTWCLSL